MMTFRQKNGTSRKWNDFYQANIELIYHIGLPGSALETWDRFAYLLMHDYDYVSGVTVKELSPEQYVSFKALIEEYFAAGFSDPGLHPWLVGGDVELLKLVRKYPNSFSHYKLTWANENGQESE